MCRRWRLALSSLLAASCAVTCPAFGQTTQPADPRPAQMLADIVAFVRALLELGRLFDAADTRRRVEF